MPSLRPLASISCRITYIHVFFGLLCALLTCPNLIPSTRLIGISVGLCRTWPNHRTWFSLIFSSIFEKQWWKISCVSTHTKISHLCVSIVWKENTNTHFFSLVRGCALESPTNNGRGIFELNLQDNIEEAYYAMARVHNVSRPLS